eukprot:scaffold50692_cov35-Attheya_sp.AAC.1
MGSNIVNYVMRPTELDDPCNLEFFVKHQNVKLSAKLRDNNEYYPYPANQALKDSHCVIDRDNTLPLLPEIPFCLLPDLANVGAIFPQEGQIISVSQSSIRERYA